MASPKSKTGVLFSVSDDRIADQLCTKVGPGLGLCAAIAAPLTWFALEAPLATAIALGGVLNSLAMWQSGRSRQGQQRVATHLGVYGALGAAFYGVLDAGVVTLALPPLLVVIAALVHSSRTTSALTGLLVALHLAASATRALLVAPPAADLAMITLIPPGVLVVFGLVIRLLVDRNEARRTELQLRLLEIEAVLPAVEELARGNLGEEVFGEGPLADATRRTKRELASLARELRANVAVLRSVAGVVDRTAVNQAKQTVQLAGAANELHGAQVQLVSQARRVAEAAAAVAAAAADSKQASSENEARLEALAQTARKVTQHHGAIRQIATKSEVLAVNAAIEAAHAGEAGRAFSSVAARLQALAEGVRSQLATAEALNAELLHDAQVSLSAATRATSSTERSATSAQQIADTAMEQRRATEQFARALAEIEAFADRVRQDSEEGRGHATRLVEVATQLAGEVARFKTDAEGPEA